MAADEVPFVLLHMLGGRGAEWSGLAGQLDCASLAPDMPGHGGNAGGTPPHVVPLSAMADHVMALADMRRLERFRLVGTSAGGAVAAHIAACYPERVAELTLVSTAFTQSASAEEMAQAEAASRGRDYDDADLPLPRALAATRAAFAISDAKVHEEMEAARAVAGAWIKPCWRGVALADVLGLLGRVEAPVRLICGEHDPYRRFLTPALTHVHAAAVHVLADCGAFPHRVHPGAVAALLR